MEEAVAPDALSLTAPEFEFGEGVVQSLPAVLGRLGVDDPLVVTDEGVADAGVLSLALDAFEGAVETYYATTEPSTEDFAGVDAFDVDGVVAVGGGSVLDTAKLVAAILAHEGDPADWIGTGKLPGDPVPLVAVPTTSGTGSQSTQTAVLTYEGVKRGVSDERLRPDAALVDPELTYGLPRGVTARSGFDAFVHALESLTARDYRWVADRPITYQGANPVTRPLSRRALGQVHGSLERAVFDGDDREARRAMSLGAHLAGLAFSNAGLGAVHALASAVGGMTGAPHGDCLAASLEPGLRYNLPVRESEYAAVARDLGVADGATDRTAALALVEECARLRDSVGLPSSFAALGLSVEDTDAIVENTLVQERRLKTNPRDVTDDVADVIRDSF
ncbi:MAG: iron-containing alcohol dehydrogenase [Haloferacaceae archaeon]